MCSNRKWKLPKIGYKQRYLVLGMEARCEVVSHTSEKSPFPQSKLMVYKTLSPLCSKPASFYIQVVIFDVMQLENLNGIFWVVYKLQVGILTDVEKAIGNPLQYFCLENPMDGGAWQAAVHRVARVGHDRATSLSLFTFKHWRRQWHPTPVSLPGESQGHGSLVGCHLWGRTESDTTEATQQQGC